MLPFVAGIDYSGGLGVARIGEEERGRVKSDGAEKRGPTRAAYPSTIRSTCNLSVTLQVRSILN